MSPWDGASRWINTILLVIVGFIGFDTLFRLLEAREENVIVGFAASGAAIFLGPFEGMFDEQDYLLTALVAVLGYALLAGVLLAATRAVQASVRRRALRRTVPPAPPAVAGGTQPPPPPAETRGLGGQAPAQPGTDAPGADAPGTEAPGTEAAAERDDDTAELGPVAEDDDQRG